MKIDARLESLGKRHRELESLISDELLRPSANDLKLYDLKRRKLAIKDEITVLEARRQPN
ncbi:MAG: YdcH family protein [Parvularcula sp.]